MTVPPLGEMAHETMTDSDLPPMAGGAAGAGPIRYKARTLTLPAAHLLPHNDLGLCLPVLLKVLGWKGDTRHLAEALPHFGGPLDVTGLRRVMVELGYSSTLERVRLNAVPDRDMPCLFLPDGRNAMVVVGRESDGIHAFEPGREIGPTTARRGWAVTFQHIVDTDEEATQLRGQSWLLGVLRRFRPHVGLLLVLTLFITALAVASPLYVMAVYDRYITSASTMTLISLMSAMGIAIAGELVLRGLRVRVLARIGARVDVLVGRSVFERLLQLSPAMTENATVGAQISRVKDFETVREFLTGPSATALLDVPFSLLIIGVVFALGGWLGLVPTIGALLLVTIGLLARGPMRRTVAETARAASARQELAIESLRNHRLLRTSGAMHIWLERYRARSARAARANYQTAQLTAFLGVLAHGTVIGCGLAALWFGASGVMSGALTTGGLIATMILLWRALAPFQQGFVVLARSEQVQSSVRQIDRLMELPPERPANALVRPVPSMGGALAVNRFSLRYSQDAEPALLGVTFSVAPGEVVAVVGRNGAGKTSLIKAVAGMLRGQTGMVQVDGMDIRRFDPVEYRRTIAYAPEEPEIFRGTVGQNIQLADPSASQAEVREAAERAGLLNDMRELPEGLDTRLGDQQVSSPSVRTRIALARVLLRKDAPIVLLDEPAGGLDADGDRALMNVISHLKGRATVLVVTHRPSHVRLADKLLELRDGQVVRFAPVDQLKPKAAGKPPAETREIAPAAPRGTAPPLTRETAPAEE